MGLLRTIFAFYTSLAVVQGYVPSFQFTAIFGDSNATRLLQIDLTSSTSVILESKAFGHIVGPNNTFDPTLSKSFKKLGGFYESYNYPYSRSTSLAGGYWGEDEVIFPINSTKCKGRIALVTSTSNYGFTQNLEGKWAGRVGFSRARGVNTLRDALFKPLNEPKLCLLNAFTKRNTATIAIIGELAPDDKNLIVRVSAEDNKEGFWSIQLSYIRIGDYLQRTDSIAVLSTTTDELVVPQDVFNKMITLFDAILDHETGRYLVSCDKNVDVRIGIDVKSVKILFSSITKKNPDDEQCTLNVKPHNRDFYVLGAPIFTQHAACFDFRLNTVSFFRPMDMDHIRNMNKMENAKRGVVLSDIIESN